MNLGFKISARFCLGLNLLYGFISFLPNFNSYSLYNFNLNSKILKKNTIKMIDNDYEVLKEIKYIKDYSFLFNKEEYNNLINNIRENHINKIYLDNNLNKLVSVDNIQDFMPKSSHYHIVEINKYLISNLVDKSIDLPVPITIKFVDFTPDSVLLIQNLFKQLSDFSNFVIPLFISYLILSTIITLFFQKPGSGPGSGPGFGPGQGSMNLNKANPFSFMGLNNKDTSVKPNVSIDSWAGSAEIKEECKEIITFLEKKEEFKNMGAEMPKGILLEGPPGTGKTLLAKAIATETNSSFYSISASEFIEVFVGVGASRVRDLFSSARKNTPSIIFIDEIDAIGRQRGTGINMGNDEREQTLNQLLYEMDGFNSNENLVVIAATNRKDVLDQALLRPGRFDRIIRVPLPDKQSREKILDYYFKDKKINNLIDITNIAELTDGFSGAQLKNLINEAAILAVRRNSSIIKESFIYDAFEKIVVGIVKTNVTILPNIRTRISLHESGHTLLSLLFNNYFIFQKVSIQPTYSGAGGFTIFSETPEIKEGGLYTKDVLKKRLIISMGGKAAESLYYGDEFVSLGATQDLKQANGIAKRMIGNFGMGKNLEVFYNEDIEEGANPFLGKSISFGEKYSENTKKIMDIESLNLVKEAYEEAKDLLNFHWDKLIYISNLLLNNTVLYNKDLINIFTSDQYSEFKLIQT